MVFFSALAVNFMSQFNLDCDFLAYAVSEYDVGFASPVFFDFIRMCKNFLINHFNVKCVHDAFRMIFLYVVILLASFFKVMKASDHKTITFKEIFLSEC